MLFRKILVDNIGDAFSRGNGAKNPFLAPELLACDPLGSPMPPYRGVIPVLDIGTVVKALR